MNRIIVVLLGIVVAVIAEEKKIATINHERPKTTMYVHLVPHNAEKRNVMGDLTIVQGDDNVVEITGTVCGLTEGLHGIHVHEKGDLRDGCTSTGPHFNPENVTHGAPDSPIRHVGDLGNIVADAKGHAHVHIRDSVISLIGKNSIQGRAIVIHSGEDDLGRGNHTLSLSTGNSGDRWACGIVLDKPEMHEKR